MNDTDHANTNTDWRRDEQMFGTVGEFEDVEQLRRSTVAGPLPIEQTRRLINEIVELQAERVRMRAELEEPRPGVAELRRRLGQLKGHLER